MSIITLILAGIVALEHLYIMYLETFATHSDTTSRVFNMSKEELQRDSVTNLFKKSRNLQWFDCCIPLVWDFYK